MHVGFIGLGNVGSKLSGSLLRNGIKLSVHDLDKDLVENFVSRGANNGKNPQKILIIYQIYWVIFVFAKFAKDFPYG